MPSNHKKVKMFEMEISNRTLHEVRLIGGILISLVLLLVPWLIIWSLQSQ